MQGMMVNIGGESFQAALHDNKAVNALIERLPIKLHMRELNGNEKLYCLREELPTESKQVGSIHTGDIMLFGSDCLVLFFDDFRTYYSYTKIGHIEDTKGFTNTLGSGTVEVIFHVEG